MKTRKKLIEVALPLEAINAASAREKSIRHGHPSTLHLWWARRPLAAARAVIFAQMVDDPSEYVGTLLGIAETRRAAERELKKRRDLWAKRKAEFEADSSDVPEPGPGPTLEDCAADIERKRLFGIVEEMVKWENTTNDEVLDRARAEIWQSWRRACADNAGHPQAKELFDRNKLPSFHDPFAGGGALPLEAQRLGLTAYASDLNPVAVLINKAMIEIPPKFSRRPPVNPDWQSKSKSEKALGVWKGAQGLAEDVRYYGKWMRDEAEKRIGQLYPKVEITADLARDRSDLKGLVGQKMTVIAWLWARTVKSPNPAFANVDVPLISTFMLSTKPGKEAYVEPVIENGGYRFTVKLGEPKHPKSTKNGTKASSRGANFICVMSRTPIGGDYIKAEAKAGRMNARLMAIVAESDRGRIYLAPTAKHEAAAREASPTWKPDVEFFQRALGFRVGNYGMTKWSDLFTGRQLATLTTFSDLVEDAMARVKEDALAAGLPEEKPLREGGVGATGYSEAVGTLLGLTSSKAARFTTTLATWRPDETKLSRAFTRNDVPITWDFAETNPFSGTGGDLLGLAEGTADVLQIVSDSVVGKSMQADACSITFDAPRIVSTDPPYYDNVGYADLSDYFYVWLRHSLRKVFADLFSTVTTPKAEELVATPDRHGGIERAQAYFLRGMTGVMGRLATQAHSAFPVTIYYAFKQSESEADTGRASTGWETFLDALIHAGFAIGGTWPVRTEGRTRMRGMSSNALASSVVLVCRPRTASAATATRREFLNALKAELPAALSHLQRGNIAPVDLAQAAIGPGMAIFTRYAKVMDAEGKRLSVREALALINQVLDEVLAEQEGDFDADSRFAIAWFEQYGFNDGEFGVADVLARAKNTAVSGLAEAKIASSKGGKVRLLKPQELDPAWDPATDPRLTVWEIVHSLIRALEAGGEAAAARLVAKLGAKAEIARELAYRLYVIAEHKKRAAEGLSYNGLVQSWPEIMRLAREAASAVGSPAQAEMFA